jgi:hypothetical protein
MVKLMFIPFRVVGGRIAGALSKRAFGAAWRLIDKQAPPPKADERRASVGKLAVALAVNGAVFRLVSGLVDHGARVAFLRLTGRWPGEKTAAARSADA